MTFCQTKKDNEIKSSERIWILAHTQASTFHIQQSNNLPAISHQIEINWDPGHLLQKLPSASWTHFFQKSKNEKSVEPWESQTAASLASHTPVNITKFVFNYSFYQTQSSSEKNYGYKSCNRGFQIKKNVHS